MTYNLTEVFNEMLKEYLTPFFKVKGFKKQNFNYYKNENGLIFLINFQKSKWNSADYVEFFINCSIESTDFRQIIGESINLFPKEYQCLFKRRLQEIVIDSNIKMVLLESSEAGKKKLAEALILELDKVIIFFQKVHSTDDLVELCLSYGIHYSAEIFKYLCIKGDMKRITHYFQSIGNIYKDKDRYLQMQHRLNTILTANGVAPMQFEAKMTVPIEMQWALD